MTQYQIWSEGYQATGEHGYATLHGEVEASTFKDACCLLAGTQASFSAYFNPDTMTYWGCRLYDTEEQARRLCG